jgi:hypothetical protein
MIFGVAIPWAGELSRRFLKSASRYTVFTTARVVAAICGGSFAIVRWISSRSILLSSCDPITGLMCLRKTDSYVARVFLRIGSDEITFVENSENEVFINGEVVIHIL